MSGGEERREGGVQAAFQGRRRPRGNADATPCMLVNTPLSYVYGLCAASFVVYWTLYACSPTTRTTRTNKPVVYRSPRHTDCTPGVHMCV